MLTEMLLPKSVKLQLGEIITDQEICPLLPVYRLLITDY